MRTKEPYTPNMIYFVSHHQWLDVIRILTITGAVGDT